MRIAGVDDEAKTVRGPRKVPPCVAATPGDVFVATNAAEAL